MAKTCVTQRDEFNACYVMSVAGQPMLNAHHYRIEVTVSGEQRFIDHGVVIEFDALKRIVRSVLPNSSFLHYVEDHQNRAIFDAFMRRGVSVKSYSFPLSAENLANYFAEEIQRILDTKYPGVRVTGLKLRENSNSFVSWSLS